eukprot:3908875-Amphidinium_carterae.1
MFVKHTPVACSAVVLLKCFKDRFCNVSTSRCYHTVQRPRQEESPSRKLSTSLARFRGYALFRIFWH